MPRLVTLGCSLSPKDSWAFEVANLLQESYEWTHLGIGASSNGIQINLLEEEIVNYGIGDNDVVICQITGQNRDWGIIDEKLSHKYAHTLDEKDVFNINNDGVGTFVTRNNPIDNKKRYMLLKHHEIVKNRKTMSAFYYNDIDPYVELQRLLFTLIMLRKSGCKVVVFRGWQGVMGDVTWNIFKEKFKLHDIFFLNECFVEWCLERNLPFLDEFHPVPKYGRIFAKDLINPILSRQIN